MGEFVEESLEKLIPVFELLQTVGLFSQIEVKEFVKRCRNYEYRLQKATKDPRDFLLYATFLRDALELVRIRRLKLKYKFKHVEIDGALKTKIADLYKRCSLRFQVHGNDISFREEAANWEFTHNNSIDNARLHLQFALRFAPEAASLWLSLFSIEVRNVQRLLKRKKVLSGEASQKKDQEEPSSSGATVEEAVTDSLEGTTERNADPVLDLKLAEIVANQALLSPDIIDKKQLLLNLWRRALKSGEVAKRLENEFFERLWSPEDVCEESWMAKYERIPNQDPYDLLDKACHQFESEKMLRYYIQICDDRALSDDVYATVKVKDLLIRLHEKGFAQLEDYKTLLSFGEDLEEKLRVLKEALERIPSSAFLWSDMIGLKIEADADKKEIERLFNEAEQKHKEKGRIFSAIENYCGLEHWGLVQKKQPMGVKVPAKDALLIYQLAIDWTLDKDPSRVDAVFKRAILTSCPEVSNELKCTRLQYCKAAYPNDPEVLREEYKRICSQPPNDISFHKAFVRLESELADPKPELIITAMETCVADFGYTQHECWMDYARYLLKHDPVLVPQLYQRALVCVPKEKVDDFNVEWTQMMQETNGPVDVKSKKSLKRRLKA